MLNHSCNAEKWERGKMGKIRQKAFPFFRFSLSPSLTLFFILIQYIVANNNPTIRNPDP